MYKHFVFDVDGTLLDSEIVVLSTLSRIVEEELGIKKSNEELFFTLGIPSLEALKLLGIQNREQVKTRWDLYMQEKLDLIVLFDGIKNILDELYKKKIIMGIVTSRSRDALNKMFNNLDLNKYFNYIVCKEDTHYHKPKPDPLLKYLELAKADPSSVIYIGDTHYDSICAFNANIDFGLALWGAKSTLDINAKYIFVKPCDILDLIVS